MSASETTANDSTAPSEVPTVPGSIQRMLNELREFDQGLAKAQGVIQERRDVLAAEWGRQVARLSVPGWELQPDFTYRKVG